MKPMLVICFLAAGAAAVPGSGYGMQSGGGYNNNYGTQPTSQSYSGPNQSYNSQPVAYLTPAITFSPPQIRYSQPTITYSSPNTVPVPMQVSSPFGGSSSGGWGLPMSMGSYGVNSQQPLILGYQNVGNSGGYSLGGSSTSVSSSGSGSGGNAYQQQQPIMLGYQNSGSGNNGLSSSTGNGYGYSSM